MNIVKVIASRGKPVSFPLASKIRYGVVKIGEGLLAINGVISIDEVTEEWLDENLTQD